MAAISSHIVSTDNKIWRLIWPSKQAEVIADVTEKIRRRIIKNSLRRH